MHFHSVVDDDRAYANIFSRLLSLHIQDSVQNSNGRLAQRKKLHDLDVALSPQVVCSYVLNDNFCENCFNSIFSK